MFKFKKEERLCKKKQIDDLFASGNSLFFSSFRVIWKEVELDMNYPAQILITVPKKNFKRAVKRNMLKRKIRESYRLNKHVLYNELNNIQKKITIIVIYSKKEILDFSRIEIDVKLMIKRIVSQITIYL